MKRTLLLALVIILALFTAACGDKETINVDKQKKDNKIQIYTTVYPLQYFAERIGGDAVQVSSIYPAGSNEHTFEPTQKDMMTLADADLFFYIGLGLEGFVENAKKTLENEHVKMVATADAVPKDELEANTHEHEEDDDDHDHGKIDPHVWISPQISQDLALSIKDSLVEGAPEQKEQFEKNYEALIAQLKELDAVYKEMARNAPNKTFFVSHAAFGYLAHEYGLEQVAVAGLNSQDEPSQKQLTKIIDLAKEKDIKYILFEQNVSSKLTGVIQKELNAKSLVLHNLGVLSKKDIENNETYFTLMNKNLETLKTALN
ncbi:metal ABC transporter solute-binding protein, Zn/Mn family [Psychrobacillus sp. L4]|uniref:metal ABC transporter solute-binding protein, Zn/Mn family n=1 Tax=Psychrobacillus sp. L4 TaxID=3236892 RepID=UPI0036F2547A